MKAIGSKGLHLPMVRLFCMVSAKLGEKESNYELLDPVDAYDRVAPIFPRLSERRRAYLNAVESLIVSHISRGGAHVSPGSRTLLDIGGADGARGWRIAQAAGIKEVTLAEPSTALRSRCPSGITIWPVRAQDLHLARGQFDVIVCLWNVLGHVFPASARPEVLRQCARLAAADGVIFLDVNHRYNARHHGAIPTALRYLRDRFRPDVTNGDVIVQWDGAGGAFRTAGHVFTDAEVRGLCDEAGLRIEERIVVDYASGQVRRRTIDGNLLFVLRA